MPWPIVLSNCDDIRQGAFYDQRLHGPQSPALKKNNHTNSTATLLRTASPFPTAVFPEPRVAMTPCFPDHFISMPRPHRRHRRGRGDIPCALRPRDTRANGRIQPTPILRRFRASGLLACRLLTHTARQKHVGVADAGRSAQRYELES